MEQALLDQLQQLPESVQQQATHYLKHLIAQHATTLDKATPDQPPVSRKDAFGIWKGQIWMAEDFDAPLEDMQEYM
jgi:Protein of unknown function (DUF2281)